MKKKYDSLRMTKPKDPRPTRNPKIECTYVVRMTKCKDPLPTRNPKIK